MTSACPSKLVIELTNRCNLNCIHCFNNTNINRISELSTEEILKIIQQSKLQGVKLITLTGGEVFIRHDIEDILKEIDRLGIAFALNTNGSHMSSRPIDLIAKYRPKCIQVSIDGPQQIHDRIRRVVGSFDRTHSFLRTIDSLAIPITLQFTAMQGTINKLYWFFDFAQTFTHIREIKVTPIIPMGRALSLNSIDPVLLTATWQSLETLLSSQPSFRVSTELLDKRGLLFAYHSFRSNPNSFLMTVIKPNGFVHPFFGLPKVWNRSHAIYDGIYLPQELIEKAIFATALSFRHGLELLSKQLVIDFNALIVKFFSTIR